MGSVKVDCYLSEYNVIVRTLIPHECASMKILQSNCGYQRRPSEKKTPWYHIQHIFMKLHE